MKTLLLVITFAASVMVASAVKPVVSGTEVLEITKRADAIILPKVSYREATVKDIVEQLNKAAKEADPRKIGVPIELSPAAAGITKLTITLTLNNVPLIEVIKYITNLGNLKYKVTASKVLISTLEEK